MFYHKFGPAKNNSPKDEAEKRKCGYRNNCFLKAYVRYFSLFLKDKCFSSLVRTKYIEKKFTLQLFFLPTVSRTFILSWATTRYPPP